MIGWLRRRAVKRRLADAKDQHQQEIWLTKIGADQ